jgi:hypothetical protein
VSVTARRATDVETWLRLNWIRVCFQDVLIPVLLVVARYLPRYVRRTA